MRRNLPQPYAVHGLHIRPPDRSRRRVGADTLTIGANVMPATNLSQTREHMRVQVAPPETVLAAMDLSERGKAIMAHAYGVVKPGGTVHLLHVVEMVEPRAQPNPLYAHYVPGRAPTADERLRELRAIEQSLEELVPADAGSTGIKTQAHAVEARDVASAIIDAAERLGVSLICIGSGRRSLRPTLLGRSVSRRLLARATVSVLIVKQP